MRLTPLQVARFVAKTRNAGHGCVEWTGATNSKGYGRRARFHAPRLRHRWDNGRGVSIVVRDEPLSNSDADTPGASSLGEGFVGSDGPVRVRAGREAGDGKANSEPGDPPRLVRPSLPTTNRTRPVGAGRVRDNAATCAARR